MQIRRIDPVYKKYFKSVRLYVLKYIKLISYVFFHELFSDSINRFAQRYQYNTVHDVMHAIVAYDHRLHA